MTRAHSLFLRIPLTKLFYAESIFQLTTILGEDTLTLMLLKTIQYLAHRVEGQSIFNSYILVNFNSYFNPLRSAFFFWLIWIAFLVFDYMSLS